MLERSGDPAVPGVSSTGVDGESLTQWLQSELSANGVMVTGTERLAGGAVQENWRIEADVVGGPHAGKHIWALRKDAAAQTGYSLDRTSEFAVLQCAHAEGILVAAPIVRCADPAVIGAPFLLQAFVPGNAQGRRLVRDTGLPSYGEALAERLGRELARIHRIRPPRPELSQLALPELPPARHEVARLRAALDTATEARPALEFVLRWLDRHAPDAAAVTLVHGDYRTGNYLVEDGQLTAILDWEFAHWGDPNEDLGWLTARCWRFGNLEKEAGGVGSRAALYRGYESEAGHAVDSGQIDYWEIMAAAKWSTIAVLQGDRYRKGGEQSIEAALTGLMAPEIELEALDGVLAQTVRKIG